MDVLRPEVESAASEVVVLSDRYGLSCPPPALEATHVDVEEAGRLRRYVGDTSAVRAELGVGVHLGVIGQRPRLTGRDVEHLQLD